MQLLPHTAPELSERQVRRRIAPLVGAITGGVAGLVVAGIVGLFISDLAAVAYIGAAVVGFVGGVVLAMLVPAEIDDGHDDAVAAPFGHDAAQGRADAPVEGAHAHDTR